MKLQTPLSVLLVLFGLLTTAAILLSVAAPVFYQTPANRFVHPGLLNSMTELEFMRSKVIAGDEPWRGGYARIPNFLGHKPQPVAEYEDGLGHSDPEDIKMQRLKDDAMAAYGSALHWIVTKNEKHAQKAIEIINTWSSTSKRIDTSRDGSLSTSYGWPCMIYAAEIIRYTYPHWSQSEWGRFRHLLLELVWPATQKARDKENGNNHRSWALMCRLTIAIHVDDRSRFGRAINELRQQIAHYIYADGQCLETPRDLWHVQMGIAPLVAAAEIGWKQDVDLYSHMSNRLLVGTNWHIPLV